MKNIIFVNSHPIQYFAPMYKYLNEHGIVTKAWYCSDFSIKGGFDKQFGVNVKWDIPLLDGYEYKFFKNYSWKPSPANGFFGLINLGIVRELFKIPPSIIVVHGWNYCTHFLVLMLGKLKGHTICIRNDMPYKHELYKKGIKQKIKKFCLGNFLFPRISKFLYVGKQNRLFYESYGIQSDRLLFCPYAVDNSRFASDAHQLLPMKNTLKAKYGIPVQATVIVFTAKYIAKKKPLDLLKAFKNLNNLNAWLIMVGEGDLRPAMENFIQANKLKNVVLTGFINQATIPEYYALADVFVMCSGLEENWGLSVNEAMNFNLPVIASDLTGCAEDLVIENANGYIFKTGDVDALTEKLNDVLVKRKLSRKPSSVEVLSNYDYSTISKNVQAIL